MKKAAHWFGRLLAAGAGLAFGGISIMVGFVAGLGNGDSNWFMIILAIPLLVSAVFALIGRRWAYPALLILGSLIYASFVAQEGLGNEFDEFFWPYAAAILIAQIITLTAQRHRTSS